MYILLETARILDSDLIVNVASIAYKYLIFAIALFDFCIFYSIPLARQAVIAQMREVMLALA